MGKTFEKQKKAIEDQGEKQIKAIQNQGQVDSPLILKEKGLFYKLANEELNKITELDNKVYTGDLIYGYKGKTHEEKRKEFFSAIGLIDKIRDGPKTYLIQKLIRQNLNQSLVKKKKDNDTVESKKHK